MPSAIDHAQPRDQLGLRPKGDKFIHLLHKRLKRDGLGEVGTRLFLVGPLDIPPSL